MTRRSATQIQWTMFLLIKEFVSLSEVMTMFILSTGVMVSQVYTDVEIYQIKKCPTLLTHALLRLVDLLSWPTLWTVSSFQGSWKSVAMFHTAVFISRFLFIPVPVVENANPSPSLTFWVMPARQNYPRPVNTKLKNILEHQINLKWNSCKRNGYVEDF